MSIKRFKMDKLIRDHLPEVMREKGIQVHEEIIDHDQYVQMLKDKLLEEAQEVLCADDMVEELADILEVVHALSKANGFTMEQVERKRLVSAG